MPIKIGDVAAYHRDPKEAASEATRLKAAREKLEASATSLAQVQAATASLPEETRRKVLQPLEAEHAVAVDAAQEWLPADGKAVISFVHGDGTVDVFLLGAPVLVHRTNVPVGPPASPRDYVTEA